MKEPKTKLVKVLQGYYDGKWGDLCTYDVKDEEQMKELKDDYKAYKENDNVPHRIVERRIPNPKYKADKER